MLLLHDVGFSQFVLSSLQLVHPNGPPIKLLSSIQYFAVKKVGPLSSHCSPELNAPLPHVGGNWQLLVSNWQFALHFKVPPMYVEISVHCLLPKSVPSHCSPASTLLLLHLGFGLQSVVSIWHD